MYYLDSSKWRATREGQEVSEHKERGTVKPDGLQGMGPGPSSLRLQESPKDIQGSNILRILFDAGLAVD